MKLSECHFLATSATFSAETLALLDDVIGMLRKHLAKMDDMERAEAIACITDGWCLLCGSDAGRQCTCEKDFD